MPNLSSSGDIKAVIAGAIHIGLSGRPLKPDEIGKGARAIEYGRTPFVFATSIKNAGAAPMTPQQLVAIYSRAVERWPSPWARASI